jgi:hypothetical protein
MSNSSALPYRPQLRIWLTGLHKSSSATKPSRDRKAFPVSEKPDAKSVRKRRLAEALRKNLGQRKLQERRRGPSSGQPHATENEASVQTGVAKDES